MTNLSSIHHANFTRLYDITNNYNKATLLDKLIYWWQISTYTLDNDQIWFTRSIEKIANDSKLSRRSVERYLQEFEANGLILKVSRLFMKKHLYIRISDQLLSLLGVKSNPTKNNSSDVEPYIKTNVSLPMSEIKTDNHDDVIMLEQDNIQETTTPPEESCTSCFIINQFGVIDSAKLACSIYKDKDSNTNNNSTVSQDCIVNNFISTPKTTTPTPLEFPVEQALNEHLTPQLKNYIKSMLTNMQTQHGLKFSNPEQLFAEVVFSVLNKDNQLTGINDPHHRVNIIAKLLREKRWLTPKGFYNHWDIGAQFKQTRADNDARYQRQKQQEMEGAGRSLLIATNTDQASALYMQHKPSQLPCGQKKLDIEQKNNWRQVVINITTEERYLKQIQQQNTQKPSELTQLIINTTMTKLAKLHRIKQQLEETLGMKNAA
jgi:hypothetical protein